MLAVALLATGCTAIDYDRAPPPDFPKLEVVVIPTGFWETQRICGGNLLFTVIACVQPNYETKTCPIYTTTDDEIIMTHERDHCRGYDHYFSKCDPEDSMCGTWKKYKETRDESANNPRDSR